MRRAFTRKPEGDARTYTVTSKKAGKVAVTSRVVISADGKPLNNTIVAEK